MGLDGLGSCAYGPEAALTILMPLGAGGLYYIGWVMAPIVGLLLILFASYWQTIRAYPSNGGAYIVARENLGRELSLLAAAALMIDYVLNVAVGISAGVGALVSAVPALHPHILALCLGILALTTIVNLRGTLDAGRLFAAPTYLFVVSFMLILGMGVFKVLTSTDHVSPVVAPPALPPATEGVGAWLLLRAFASGCTAMTGVEAVSNGMTAFRDPPVKYGHRTLTAIVVILGVLLAGITYLSSSYGIAAMDQTRPQYQSVLSQLAHAIVGSGWLYYVAIGSVLCVLALSANTSFVDFPRLCRTVAADGFLPKSFAIAGHRLVFSVGILYLATAAGLLLLIFGGITDRLIPLFAIGAFLTFTLSQTGMVCHWQRALKSPSGKPRQRTHLWINTVGALATGTALLVIIVAKFAAGAWITLVAIPATIALLKGINNYYEALGSRLRDPTPLRLVDTRPPLIIITTASWSKLTDKALRFALSMSPDVFAVHLTQLVGPDSEEHDLTLRSRWRTYVEEPAKAAGLRPPRLITLQARYRAMYTPLLELARELEAATGRRIAILIPEVVRQRWYQYLLHTFRTARLQSQLLKHGGPSLIVMRVPWYLDPPLPNDSQRR